MVIGLFSTGEALMGDDIEESEELFSAPKQILLNMVYMRTNYLICTDVSLAQVDKIDVPDELQDIKAAIVKDIQELVLPENPLDNVSAITQHLK